MSTEFLSDDMVIVQAAPNTSQTGINWGEFFPNVINVANVQISYILYCTYKLKKCANGAMCMHANYFKLQQFYSTYYVRSIPVLYNIINDNYQGEIGILNLIVSPVDLDVVGAGSHSANLIHERILDSEFQIYGQAMTIEIPWSHVISTRIPNS